MEGILEDMFDDNVSKKEYMVKTLQEQGFETSELSVRFDNYKKIVMDEISPITVQDS